MIDWSRKELLRLQNSDGGWGYSPGKSSWTEPTAMAMLAVHGFARASPQAQRGVDWLGQVVRPDGGVTPSPTVEEGSWVTALVVLVESLYGRLPPDAPSVRWLVDRSGEESRLLIRLRRWLLAVKSEEKDSVQGWPWLAGASAWVAPTAWTVIALSHVHRRTPTPDVFRRLDDGRKFLLSRQCPDGGWNYGAARALGYEAPSYPETTGIALLALRGQRSAAVDRGLDRALFLLRTCNSIQARSWLILGLLAHGRRIESPEPPLRVRPAPVDLAMNLLAHSAAQEGVLI
ncbi:MAG TPA: prenyltransferase/squalene oxidase repeat-containing protein [Bryobacteraceae bacterium]|nr:prenyltransferase/squalene oxidase repeat-containing protein [Bryobacteraceae bacterium]